MARALAIDYGFKRTGIATTDPLQMIASPKETVSTHTIFDYLDKYFKEEDVSDIVLGKPLNLDGGKTDSSDQVKGFHRNLKKRYPDKVITLIDERFTSKLAQRAMVQGGMKKKDRQKKENVDMISAAIILQSFLDQKSIA